MMQKLFALFFLAFLTFQPVALMAQAQQQAPGELANHKGENCRAKFEGKFLAVIVPCITDVVFDVTDRINRAFSNFLNPAILAFCALVVTIFGIKVATNEGDPKKDGFILLFKLGVVFMMIVGFGGFTAAVFDTMLAGANLTGNIFTTTLNCDEFTGQRPWSLYDCILGHLMGFAKDNYIGISLVAFVGTMPVSGQFGTMLFIGALSALFLMFRLIAKAVYSFLVCVIGAGIYIIIAPLFIPLILLQVTNLYFEQWLRGLVSLIIFPSIIVAFITLSFTILDKMMFEGPFALAPQIAPDSVKEWRMGRESENADAMISDNARYTAATGLAPTDQSQIRQFNSEVPFASGATDNNWMNQFYRMDMRSDQVSKAQKLFFSLIAFAVTAYLLDLVYGSLVSLASIMLGGAFFIRASIDNNPIDQGLNQIQGEANKLSQGGGTLGNIAGGINSMVTGLGKSVLGNVSGRGS